MKDFLYRQHQRFKYHTTSDKVRKNIFELNRNKELVEIRDGGFYIKELDFLVPRAGFDFVFNPKSFDYLISNARNLQGQYWLENSTLIFGFGAIEVEIISASELFIVNEVFVQRCYDFRIPDKKVAVIDVGMNVGLASIFFASNCEVETVYSFEPFVATYKQAKANLSRNMSVASKIKTFNFGLGDRDENLKAAYNAYNSGVNSTLGADNSEFHTRDLVDLKIKAAQEVIAAITHENPALAFILKIDTEGAEYAIFSSLFNNVLPDNIIGFMVEWHIRGPAELEAQLVKAGFKLISTTLTNNSGLIYAFR